MPEEKIELIAKCIRNHRGSKDYKRESIEEQIVACADAMSHINGCLIFIYLAGTQKEDYKEKLITKTKTKRSWVF